MLKKWISSLAITIGIITSRHYLSERNIIGTKNRELLECNARLEACLREMAEHGCRLADYEKLKKSTSSFGDAIAAELTIFSFGLLFGLGFTLANRVVDSLYGERGSHY